VAQVGPHYTAARRSGVRFRPPRGSGKREARRSPPLSPSRRPGRELRSNSVSHFPSHSSLFRLPQRRRQCDHTRRVPKARNTRPSGFQSRRSNSCSRRQHTTAGARNRRCKTPGGRGSGPRSMFRRHPRSGASSRKGSARAFRARLLPGIRSGSPGKHAHGESSFRPWGTTRRLLYHPKVASMAHEGGSDRSEREYIRSAPPGSRSPSFREMGLAGGGRSRIQDRRTNRCSQSDRNQSQVLVLYPVSRKVRS